ncbi:MAG: hypothetical protein JNG84_14685 [Archangium sp.]|nr:hypothetical protein [Archangium sp.]
MKLTTHAVTVALALIATGCTKLDESLLAWVSAKITAANGGTLATVDGKVKLTFPPGAVKQDTTFRIAEDVMPAEAAATLGDVERANNVFRIEPEVELDAPVRINLDLPLGETSLVFPNAPKASDLTIAPEILVLPSKPATPSEAPPPPKPAYKDWWEIEQEKAAEAQRRLDEYNAYVAQQDKAKEDRRVALLRQIERTGTLTLVQLRAELFGVGDTQFTSKPEAEDADVGTTFTGTLSLTNSLAFTTEGQKVMRAYLAGRPGADQKAIDAWKGYVAAEVDAYAQASGEVEVVSPAKRSFSVPAAVSVPPNAPVFNTAKLDIPYLCKFPGDGTYGVNVYLKLSGPGGATLPVLAMTSFNWVAFCNEVAPERPPRCAGPDFPEDRQERLEDTLIVLRDFGMATNVTVTACPVILDTPIGEVTFHSNGQQQKASDATQTEVTDVLALRTAVNQSTLDTAVNNSVFECGAGDAGYTICASPKGTMLAGDYFFMGLTTQGDIPLADPTNQYQYAFVFDSDGASVNNYTPIAAYPKDFFKGSDRWYELLYRPSMGWSIKVSDLRSGTAQTVTSPARAIIRGNSLMLVVPALEMTSLTPSYRATAFRHTGDFGLSAPFNWSANVYPAVDVGLAPFDKP